MTLILALGSRTPSAVIDELQGGDIKGALETRRYPPGASALVFRILNLLVRNGAKIQWSVFRYTLVPVCVVFRLDRARCSFLPQSMSDPVHFVRVCLQSPDLLWVKLLSATAQSEATSKAAGQVSVSMPSLIEDQNLSS